MDALPGSTVALRIPAWVADLPAWVAQVAWMALGAVAGAVAAALVEDAFAFGATASPALAAASLLLPLAGLGMLAGGLVPLLRASPLFALSAGAASSLALGLGTPVGALLGLSGLLVPLAAVLLRRDGATQAAATAFLAIGILSFQAAAGFHNGGFGVLLVALAATPALVTLRGTWRGLAAFGVLLAAFAAML